MTRLRELCESALDARDLGAHAPRLAEELREIEAQNEDEYLLDLHDRGTRYPKNQNNLLVAYLLGIVADVDLGTDPAYEMGEMPDIDVDFLGPTRDYLRNDWAPRTFGADYVCAIGSYTTFGIKSAFIDMARVFGLDTKEINAITKKLEMKDDEKKLLTFDKALALNDDLRDYCNRHPEVHDAVRRIVNRIRGMGTHAGGLVISSRRIDDFVPLVRGKDEAITSAWVEGLHGQDLGPMGLIKFDLLGITDLMRVALGCMLVKTRHGLANVCADPAVGRDWSDTSYLQDPLSLAMANESDLLGIFQFDSAGIRRLVKETGVDFFEDLVAISALYRPGPRESGMTESYGRRKRGIEPYEIHPKLQKILGPTHGILVFQEQMMQILNQVGNIPLKDCELVRKAVSKKKVATFQKYKDMFVENGKVNLGWEEDRLLEFWDLIAAFGAYAFNLSHAVVYTYVSSRLLYLKSHYPLEFFAATLSCEKTVDKIKEYKRDCLAFGRAIRVRQVDINRSKKDFAIDGGDVYYGLADLKGVGDAVAQRIVDGQPYADLQDFLERFGTDAAVCVPLIELGCFGMDRDRKRRFYDRFKDHRKKQVERDKRFVASRARSQNKILAATGNLHMEADFAAAFWREAILDWTPEERRKETVKAIRTYDRSLEENARKRSEDAPLDLAGFEPDGVAKADDAYSENERAMILSAAEDKHYGFRWTHPVEVRVPDFKTFEDMRKRDAESGYVDLLVKSLVAKTKKKAAADVAKAKKELAAMLGEAMPAKWADEPEAVQGQVIAAARGVVGCDPVALYKATGRYLAAVSYARNSGMFYSLIAEDANSEANTINVWDVDYARFGAVLEPWKAPDGAKVGNLVRLELLPPSGGYPTYSLKSWKKYEYERCAPRRVEDDLRVTLLERAEVWTNWGA